MVQNMSRDPGPYSRPFWQGERVPMEPAPAPEEARYHEVAMRSSYPITMGELLRRHCHIKAQNYFVAVYTDDGRMEYYAGPHQVAHPEKLFNVDAFLHSQGRAGSVTSSSQGDENPFEEDDHRLGQMEYMGPRRRLLDRRRNQTFDDCNLVYRTTKRPRVNHMSRREAEDSAPAVVQTSKKGLKIGDSEAVWNFYDQRFKNCQQTACKLVAKAWVKAVEPRKQSNHPYTGPVSPDWWPKPWGTGPDNRVRHKEPDHLYKRERVYLLIHILRLIVEPNANQHPDIRNMDLDVSKLEEVTMECLNGFFADKENPKNALKKPYLKEIFKVARFEQRFKNGEIDGEHEIFVMADDKIPDNYQSDDEDNERDDEIMRTPNTTTASGNSSLERTTAISAPAQDASYMGEMHPPQMVGTDGLPPSHHHPYVDGSNMNHPPLPSHPPLPVPDIMPSPHDNGRRPSVFSPTEFHSPSGPGIYGGGWQQGTTATTNPAMYAFTPQQQSPQQPQGPGTFLAQSGVPLGQTQAYMQPQFDGMARPYDPGQSHMYRGGGVTSPSVVGQPQGYTNYLAHDDRQNQAMKLETTLARGPLH